MQQFTRDTGRCDGKRQWAARSEFTLDAARRGRAAAARPASPRLPLVPALLAPKDPVQGPLNLGKKARHRPARVKDRMIETRPSCQLQVVHAQSSTYQQFFNPHARACINSSSTAQPTHHMTYLVAPQRMTGKMSRNTRLASSHNVSRTLTRKGCFCDGVPALDEGSSTL